MQHRYDLRKGKYTASVFWRRKVSIKEHPGLWIFLRNLFRVQYDVAVMVDGKYYSFIKKHYYGSRYALIPGFKVWRIANRAIDICIKADEKGEAI